MLPEDFTTYRTTSGDTWLRDKYGYLTDKDGQAQTQITLANELFRVAVQRRDISVQLDQLIKDNEALRRELAEAEEAIRQLAVDSAIDPHSPWRRYPPIVRALKGGEGKVTNDRRTNGKT